MVLEISINDCGISLVGRVAFLVVRPTTVGGLANVAEGILVKFKFEKLR